MVDLKKTNNEKQANNRLFAKPPFIRPNQPPQNPPPPNPSEGFTSEEIFYDLKSFVAGTKSLATGTQNTPESSDD